MNYIVYVSLGGDVLGEYSGIKHKKRREAKKELLEALKKPRILEAWIIERGD